MHLYFQKVYTYVQVKMYFVTYNKLIIHKYHNFLGVSHHMTENHRKCVLEKVNSSHCMYELNFITFIKIVF